MVSLYHHESPNRDVSAMAKHLPAFKHQMAALFDIHVVLMHERSTNHRDDLYLLAGQILQFGFNKRNKQMICKCPVNQRTHSVRQHAWFRFGWHQVKAEKPPKKKTVQEQRQVTPRSRHQTDSFENRHQARSFPSYWQGNSETVAFFSAKIGNTLWRHEPTMNQRKFTTFKREV